MELFFKDEAVVLKKTQVGDTDLSILVYMKNTGKENIYIPKGQLIKSFFPSVSEPFNWLKGVFFKKKGKVFIKEVEQFQNLAFPISKDINRFYTGAFILSTFNRYVFFDDEKLFIFLKKTIYYLTKTKNFEVFKLNFLAKLIYLSGIYPQLDECISCRKKINRKNFGSLSIKEAGCLCKQCTADKSRFLDFDDILDLKKLQNVSFKSLENVKLKHPKKLMFFLEEYLSKKM
jgi:DNA repair protein RecO (recombination protein O)